jgi:hypothetical protein
MYAIGRSPKSHHAFSRAVQLAALEDVLSDLEIDAICQELGHRWRRRIFTPGVTVRSLVYRRLYPSKSIRAALADLLAGDPQLSELPADSSWCEARSRLPQALWSALIDHSTQRLQELAASQYLYAGREVYLADGSTVSMPDTPELVEAFGYADTKHGPSRFPVARITFLTHAGTEAVVDYRLGPYRTSEDAHFQALWESLPDGCICICDRKFGSFHNLAKLSQRRIDVICPLHQRRHPHKLIAGGTPIGPNQWRVHLDLAPQLRKRYDDPTLPQRLDVRLIRVRFVRNHKRKTLWLVTTLLDPLRHPRADLVRLYRRRWGIETRIGSLKTTLEMNVLPSHTPKAVRYDVAATMLAHNLLWTLIHQAAATADAPADRISFTAALQITLAFSPVLRAARPHQRSNIYRRMLRNIARCTNPSRPGRIEPRLIKRQTRRYGFLKTSRATARRNG